MPDWVQSGQVGAFSSGSKKHSVTSAGSSQQPHWMSSAGFIFGVGLVGYDVVDVFLDLADVMIGGDVAATALDEQVMGVVFDLGNGLGEAVVPVVAVVGADVDLREHDGR
jgi:hypothetical protein